MLGCSLSSATSRAARAAPLTWHQYRQGHQHGPTHPHLHLCRPPAAAPRPALRSYQEESVRKVLAGNTIVMLPTGAGKTLVAAEAMLRIQPQPQARALFLVPTCLLVEQQARAVREWTGRRVGEFKGGISLPRDFDILVATPKAFQQAQPLHPHLAWSSFQLVVFDEVHHVLKEHPYRQLALSLRLAQHSVRILGLTASLTYAVTEQRVQEAMQRICLELKISHIATATAEQLQAAGYLARATPAEVIQVPQDEQAPGPSEGSGVVRKPDRKPHLMTQTFFNRVHVKGATGFALRLMQCIRAMEGAVAAAAGKPFSSPLERLPMREWGKYAQDHVKGLRRGCVLEEQQCMQLSQWYEALKLLVVTWEEEEDAAVMLLRMADAGGAAPGGVAGLAAWPPAVQAALRAFWAGVRPSYPRMEHLKDILRKQLDASSASGSEFRGILFVEQRVMTHVLEAVIAADPQLRQRLRTACFYAPGSPATASLSITPTQAKQRLADFSCGAVNLLISTVVAEEGMDVPAANCVIRFDPMINAVSLVQGRGRARQADSSFVVLSEREDRPAALLEQVEQQQGRIARSYQPQQTLREQEVKEQQQQTSRERGALPLLTQYREGGTALQTLNLYVRKTRALLTDSWAGEGPARAVCVLRYTSALRDVVARGEAPNRKHAKDAAAGLMIQKLRAGAT